jgi:hypothetical protein
MKLMFVLIFYPIKYFKKKEKTYTFVSVPERFL